MSTDSRMEPVARKLASFEGDEWVFDPPGSLEGDREGTDSSVYLRRAAGVLDVVDETTSGPAAGRLLGRLSASGGRNIDLLKRAHGSEAAVAGVRELHRKVWFAWIELDGKPGAGYICDHCTPSTGTELTHYPCPTINVLDGSKS